MKNIEWLQREIHKELESWQGVEGGIDGDGINEIMLLIDQLDEPEITLDKALEKVAESYPMTKEEIWRHLERLVAHGGKVTYGEPEALSQKWIDNHTACAYTIAHYSEEDVPVVIVSDLQNLLVPKQEEADRAYKDSYEKGKQHVTEKQSEETETVARVLVDYLIASAKLKLALSMEVEEMEE